MKIWMSKQTNRRNLFAAHTIAGMLGILLLAALLIAGTAALVLASEEYKEASALLLCLLVSAVLIFLACRLGRSRLRDAVIFFKDDEERLYVLDARQSVPYRRGFTGSIRSSMEIQQKLDGIKREAERKGTVPPEAVEILKVERIKEHAGSCSLVCRIRRDQGQAGKWTYHLIRGYEGEEELRYQLERKRTWTGAVLPEKNRNPLGIFLSLPAFVLFGLLGLGSHPALALLPQKLYFPCLAGTALSLYSLIYFLVRQRRGE